MTTWLPLCFAWLVLVLPFAIVAAGDSEIARLGPPWQFFQLAQ